MKTRPVDKQKIEEYARSLLDAAKGSVDAPLDLERIRNSTDITPEAFELLGRMQNESDVTLLAQLYEDLLYMLESDDDVVTVDVTTAVPMDAGLRRKVREKCVEDFNKPVFLVEHVDSKIVGGIILEAEGRRRDASVRTQLATIRKTLSSTFMGGVE